MQRGKVESWHSWAFTARFARGAESAEVSIFSIAVDLPSLKLWQGNEDGNGKLLSRWRCEKTT
jgi:hypothetical protein